jgi:phospholipid transport system substrate-binding protein
MSFRATIAPLRPLATILTLALALAPAARAADTKSATKSTKSTKSTMTAAKAAPKAPAKGEPVAAAEKAAPAPAPAGGAAGAAGSDKGSPTPPTTSPMAELKKSNADLDKVLKRNVPNWTPEAELQRTEVRKLVGSFLDYNELARRSLGRHWDTLTPKQREDFSNTLRDLVERSYLKQLHGNANYSIKYEKEQKSGNEATVDATLHTTARGKKVEVALQYKLLGKDGHWLVYDVLTDEQSMLENYRAEFNKIINKDGFDALMKRMKKKLDEKDE